MNKKRAITLSIIFGVMLMIVLIISTVFTLNTIDYQLTAMFVDTNRSRLFANGSTVSSVEQKLDESADFSKGCNLLFTKFDGNIENMEKAVPYAKIEKIVRSFPNKITVYYCEREAVALLPSENVENAYFVVDNTLKVLDYITDENTSYNLPIINYLDIKFNAKPGQTIVSKQLQSYVKTFVDCAFTVVNDANALYEEVMKPFEEIKFYIVGTSELRCSYLTIADNDSKLEFEIFNINEKFSQKCLTAIHLQVTDFSQDPTITDTTFTVYYNSIENRIELAKPNGEIV